MENRERDRVSQRATPTDAGQLNRQVEEEKGRAVNSGTSAEFGQSIGRSENLSEGGEMRNRNQDDLMNTDKSMDESSRRSGSEGYGSSSGRKGGSKGNMGNMDEGSSEMNKSSNRSSTGELGSTGSSEGRH